MSVQNIQNKCVEYFKAPATLCSREKEVTASMRVAAFLKTASFFTIIIPIAVACTLAITTLIGRVKKSETAEVKILSPSQRLNQVLVRHNKPMPSVKDEDLEIKGGAIMLQEAYNQLKNYDSVQAKEFFASDKFMDFKGRLPGKSDFAQDLLEFFVSLE